jgi:hypothetical protein
MMMVFLYPPLIGQGKDENTGIVEGLICRIIVLDGMFTVSSPAY